MSEDLTPREKGQIKRRLRRRLRLRVERELVEAVRARGGLDLPASETRFGRLPDGRRAVGLKHGTRLWYFGRGVNANECSTRPRLSDAGSSTSTARSSTKCSCSRGTLASPRTRTEG
jgi:hypothetical protein